MYIWSTILDIPIDDGKFGHDNTGEFETGFTEDEMNSTFPDYESYLDWRYIDRYIVR